jgi:hypothetical protein
MMDVTLALQRAVRGFPHGTAALATRMRMSQTSLLHKVSPTYPGAHCSPDEMLEIMEATGDDGPLEAMAATRGKLLIAAPSLGEDGSEASRVLAATVQEFGQFVSEVAGDLADGVITRSELERIEREGAHALASIHALLQLTERLNQAGAERRAKAE